jgi:tetratricopeptide (TPR) repeat protein
MVQKHKPTLNKDTLESYVMPGIASATKDLYTNLAYSYYLADMPDKAVQFINEKALIKFPSSARLYFLLGVAEYKANNKQKALEAIDKAYQLVSSADFRQMLRFAQYQINNDIPLNLTPE